MLLLEVAHGHRLHRLVRLHQQLADLLKHPGLDAQQVSMSYVSIVNTEPVVVLCLDCLAGRLLLQFFPLIQLILSCGAQLGALFCNSGCVSTPLPLLVPLNVDGPCLPQLVHLVMHSFQLLVPALLQTFPHLLMLGPSGLKGF